MKRDKEIIIEFVDEDLDGLIEQQDKEEFLAELKTLNLKYNLKNMEKYAKYLNVELTFPLTGHFTIDNGLFGMKKIDIEIDEIIENVSRKGVKCLGKTSKNSIQKVPLHKIEIEETNDDKKIIDHFKKWYFKNKSKNK